MANTELLHKVLQHIKNNPEQYDRQRWHRDFAGWTLRLALPGVEARTDHACGTETLFDAHGDRIWIADIGPQAQKLLGLDDRQAGRLFSATNDLWDLERIVAELTTEVTA